jgi:hypothetical protein
VAASTKLIMLWRVGLSVQEARAATFGSEATVVLVVAGWRQASRLDTPSRLKNNFIAE